MKRFPGLCFAVLLLFAGCGNMTVRREKVIIFHAGSLSVPLKMIAGEFEKENPGVKVLLEPAGSIVCARMVTELKRPCDIILSADYFVIDELLKPDYADWNLCFATNEMVLAYTGKSKYANIISSDNWPDILLRKDVTYSRADADSDPGGYRTLMTFMLSEKHYGLTGITEKLKAKNTGFIRPKEVDLVALLEINAVDYIFIYKSVAIQHNFKYLDLPDDVNLSDPALNEVYRTVSFYVRGKSPSDSMKVTGEYIKYSATILNNAQNPALAEDFMDFLLSKHGMDIFRKCSQDTIFPFSADHPELIPEKLLKYIKP